jgi:hypothetical protein
MRIAPVARSIGVRARCVAVRAAGAIALTAVSVQAQSTALPNDRVCDMSARVVSVRLVDAQARGVGGATITVRRVRTGARLPQAAAMGSDGDYLIAQDGDLPDVRPGGEPLEITFRRTGRVLRHRVVIGMDAARCHLELKRGAAVIRWR